MQVAHKNPFPRGFLLNGLNQDAWKALWVSGVCQQEDKTQNCSRTFSSYSLGKPPQASATWGPGGSQGLRKGLYHQKGLKNSGSVWQDLWEGPNAVLPWMVTALCDTSQGPLRAIAHARD